MPFDGIITKHISHELNNALAGGRIRKIYQPELDEIRLTVNKDRTNYTLLASANPNNARVHLTETSKPNPDVPPTFCMTLRKHLTNSEILRITQIESDRVLALEMSSKDDFGEPCIKRLICEITGRNSNLILTQKNEQGEIILDSLKKIGSGKSRFRQILPGKDYVAPPADGKSSFYNIDSDHLMSKLNLSTLNPERFFTSNFLGISPAAVREICYRCRIDSQTLLSELTEGERKRLGNAFLYFLKHLEDSTPTIYSTPGRILDFYGPHLSYLDAQEATYPSYSRMLEAFYEQRDKKMHFRTKSANLRHNLETLQKKNAKKLQNLDKDYKKSLKNAKNKLYGDLITANIWQLEKGLKEAELLDYTKDPPETVKVPLKVNETPSQNAQRYYKKYNKNKRAQEQLEKQITLTQDELNYIESLLNTLSLSTELEELDEIQYEFNHSGLIPVKNKAKSKKPKPSKPLHYISSEGFDIYVGKNNYQNDYITTKLGTDEDCWLHVKNAPGSHVLIVADGRFITEQTVLEGGMLAAYYSKMSQSENIPVDYMEHKFVKKPRNAKPGRVIFTEHNTMYITPDIERIENLRQVN